MRYTTQERSPLVETATELQAQQESSRRRSSTCAAGSGATEQAGAGSAAVVRELNDAAQDARIAAGLIPLTGTGIVLQLEDSLAAGGGGRQRGRLPRRRARPPDGRRGALARRRARPSR